MSSFSSPPPPRVLLFCVLLLFPISFPERVQFTFFLSLSEKRRKRRLLLATAVRVADVKSSVLCARALSLSASQKVATKNVNLKPVFSPFQTSGKHSKTPQSSLRLLFYAARITRKTFAHRKRIRERDDDATRREEASPRIHRPDAFLFFFFFFHPRRGRIFAL